MPQVTLTPSFVAQPPPCPSTKSKITYFDSQVTGFMLEVRPSGKATYYQRYRDNSGRLKQARIGPTDALTLEQARQKAQHIRSLAVVGVDPLAEKTPPPAMPTLRQFAEGQYLPYAQTHKRSWLYDKGLLENHILPLWGQKRLDAITRQDIEALQRRFMQQGYQPGTANRHLALLKHMFNLAQQWEVITASPAGNVKPLTENNHKQRFLSAEETQRLIAALQQCHSPVVPDLIEFLIVTGARKNEAAQAKWQDIDWDTKLWTIPLSKSGKARHVPLSTAALRVLQRRWGPDNPYIFPNPKTGKPLKHLHNTWDRIRRKAGLADVRIHDLRHTFASVLVNSGRSLYEVQRLLGHSGIQTTQRYAHLAQDTLQEAAEIVGQHLPTERADGE